RRNGVNGKRSSVGGIVDVLTTVAVAVDADGRRGAAGIEDEACRDVENDRSTSGVAGGGFGVARSAQRGPGSAGGIGGDGVAAGCRGDGPVCERRLRHVAGGALG